MGGLLRGALNKLKGWVLGNEAKQTEHFVAPVTDEIEEKAKAEAAALTEKLAQKRANRGPDSVAPTTTTMPPAAKVEAVPPASQFNTTGQKPIMVNTMAEAHALRQGSAAIARTLPEGAAPRASVDKFTAQSLAVLDSPQGSNFGRDVLLDASRVLQKHTPDDPAAVRQLEAVMRLSHSKQIDAIVKREVQMSGLHGAKAAQLAANNLEDVRLILGTGSTPKSTMDSLTALERNLDVLRAQDPRAAAEAMEKIAAVMAPRAQQLNGLTPEAKQRFGDILIKHNDDMRAHGHGYLAADSMARVAQKIEDSKIALPNNSLAKLAEAEQRRLHRPVTTQSVPQKPSDADLDFTKPATGTKPTAPASVAADNDLDFTYIAAKRGDDLIKVPDSFGKPDVSPSFADIATSRPVSVQKPLVADAGSPNLLPREGSVGGPRSRNEDPAQYPQIETIPARDVAGNTAMNDADFDAEMAREATRSLRQNTKGPGF